MRRAGSWLQPAAGKRAPPFTPPQAVQEDFVHSRLPPLPAHMFTATPTFNLPPTRLCTLLFLLCLEGGNSWLQGGN
jgi:hypothetical protein